MKVLADLKDDSELQKAILWNFTPEQNFRSVEIRDQADLDNETKRREAQAGYYFFIDLWNVLPGLFLFENRPDGTGGVAAGPIGAVAGHREFEMAPTTVNDIKQHIRDILG